MSSNPSLKFIEYSNKLYRSDDVKQKNSAQIYPGASYKFFALTPKNTESYITHNTPELTKLKVKSGKTLKLIDILDYYTRINLAKIIGSNALDIAFPLSKYNNNDNDRLQHGIQPEYDNNMNKLNTAMILNIDVEEVRRFSNTNNTTGVNPDYVIIKAICDKGLADGYYMDPKGKFFHTEVALCRSGLDKLELIHENSYQKTTKNFSRTLPAVPKKPSKSRLAYTLGGKRKNKYYLQKTRKQRKARR